MHQDLSLTKMSIGLVDDDSKRASFLLHLLTQHEKRGMRTTKEKSDNVGLNLVHQMKPAIVVCEP